MITKTRVDIIQTRTFDAYDTRLQRESVEIYLATRKEMTQTLRGHLISGWIHDRHFGQSIFEWFRPVFEYLHIHEPCNIGLFPDGWALLSRVSTFAYTGTKVWCMDSRASCWRRLVRLRCRKRNRHLGPESEWVSHLQQWCPATYLVRCFWIFDLCRWTANSARSK